MASSATKPGMFEKKKVKKKMSKAQMQLAIIKKKQCDAKALTIVEQLIEPRIDSDWLLRNLKHIDKSHMEDVIEERAIIELCGYVLCDNELKTVISQRYHISTRENKVYDVTRRKNFCSSRCYGACNYLLEQMLTSPLWLRDEEEIPAFKILTLKDASKRSTPGDEIIVRDTDLLNSNGKDGIAGFEARKDLNVASANKRSELRTSNEHETLENSQTVNETTKIIADIETSEIFKESFPRNSDEEFRQDKNEFGYSENMDSKCKQSIDDTVNQVPNLENDPADCAPIRVAKELKDISSSKDGDREQERNEEDERSNELKIECDTTIIKEDSDIGNDYAHEKGNKLERYRQKNCAKEKQPSEFYNLAVNIECNVKEWITEDTVNLLSGEESVKNRLLENITRYDRYLYLCKKLNKLQLEDEKDDREDLTGNTLKPLPHLSVLEEEGKKMELKVRAFYKGDMVVETPRKTTENTEENDEFAPVFPLTDAHAPRALRRRIFLDKLNRILPDLLRALAGSKLPHHIYSGERSALIKALIGTFSLSATNITFKTAEWTLVGLIVIKMLSMIDSRLKVTLSTRQASMYISMILMSYKLDSNYLDRLVMELTDTKIHDIDSNATDSKCI